MAKAVNIQTANSNGETFNVKLKDVLYIPSFNGNLLSVNKILKNGFKVIFNESNAKIVAADEKEIGYAEKSAGLIQLLESQQAMSATCNSTNCQHYWHKIFVHREMEKRELAKGLKIRVCGVKKVCDICVKCRRSLSKKF